MSVAETLTGLQRELKKIVGNSLVLLGGSHFHGGAVESSDVDFFVVVSWLNFFKVWKKRKVIKKWEGRSAEVKINVMIVPRFFYNRGWYYISGCGLGGKKFCSKLRSDLVLRNAFKLSAFYGLKFLNNLGDDWKRKAGKQLAIAKLIMCDQKENLTAIEPIEWGRDELLKLSDGYVWKFSWANYFIYNLKFLPKFDCTFLFSNPDKMIWCKLKKCLEQWSADAGEMAWLEKYVFPVIII